MKNLLKRLEMVHAAIFILGLLIVVVSLIYLLLSE